MLSRNKKGVGEEPTGLRSIRQTQSGDVLLEFAPSVNTEGFSSSVKCIQGEDPVEVEISDVDPWRLKKDVLDAFRKVAAEGDCVECKVLRTGLLGMQVAVVSRVKVVLKVTRCYVTISGIGATRCPICKTGRKICRKCGGKSTQLGSAKSRFPGAYENLTH